MNNAVVHDSLCIAQRWCDKLVLSKRLRNSWGLNVFSGPLAS